MRLTNNCPICLKDLVEVVQFPIGAEVMRVYKCGHSFADVSLIPAPNTLDFTNVHGNKKARPYQESGVQFLADHEYTGIIGDQMRLGKTPQSLLAIKNALRLGIKKQVLILVRAANLYQWLEETKDWVTNDDPLGVYTISGTKNWVPPGFKIYIMSMDTFSRRGTCKLCNHQYHEEDCKKCTSDAKKMRESGMEGKYLPFCNVCIPAGDAMSDILLKFGFDQVIVDEAHSFKNTDSNRSQALTAFLKTIERSELVQTIPFVCMMCREQWEETITIKVELGDTIKRTTKDSHCPKCFSVQKQSAASHTKVTRKCSIILLSGTSIKNNADEYFVPLNLVAPTIFTSKERFRSEWLYQDSKKRWRLSPARSEEFKKMIAPYVLRREKEDVYTDLPTLNRIFTVIEISDERLKKAYNKVLDTIEENMAGKADFSFFSNIGELQQLRQICGMAKVPFIADYAETFLHDSEKAKVAIGIHHKSVRDTLASILSDYGCVKLSGEDSAERKFSIMKSFEHSPEQLLIINMLAGGVGMDFHYIDNVLIAERQWNSADEDQFEYRFYNPDKSIKDRPTQVEYIIAKGTVDQFFHDMIEDKREIFGETIANNWSITTDENSFKNLMQRVVANRL